MPTSSYKLLKNIYRYKKENYFVSYAVRGPISYPSYGIRQDMPIRCPLKDSPVVQPSPLNVSNMANFVNM